MSEVIDLARFKIAPETEAEFLARRPAMVAAVRELAALRGISLVRLGDDTWLDVIVWESREAADEAIKVAHNLPAVREWLRYVTEDLSADHGVVLDWVFEPIG